jgi:hypothetical protein
VEDQALHMVKISPERVGFDESLVPGRHLMKT